MTDFNLGDGWREARDDERAQLTEWIDLPNGNKTTRRWVREAPVQPLPTEPYTVIHVTWADKNAPEDFIRRLDGDWQDAWGSGRKYSSDALHGLITGFEVLAEPRAVTPHAGRDIVRATANAVLYRVRQTDIWQVILLANPKNGDELDKIGRDFGVES